MDYVSNIIRHQFKQRAQMCLAKSNYMAALTEKYEGRLGVC